MSWFLLATLACAQSAAPATAGTPPRAEVSKSATPLVTLTLEEGYFEFVSARGVPNTRYHVRGEMVARIFDDWVVVQLTEEDGTPKVHTAPRDLVTYIGTWDLAASR